MTELVVVINDFWAGVGATLGVIVLLIVLAAVLDTLQNR